MFHRHLLQYQEPIPCEQLVSTLCDVKQAYTQFGGTFFYLVTVNLGGGGKTKNIMKLIMSGDIVHMKLENVILCLQVRGHLVCPCCI